MALETDAHRPKRDRRTAKRLFETIRQKGYTGGYSQLTDFIRRTRQHATSTGKSAFVPLKFQLGEAFQFDWSEEWLVIGGIYRKILVAHTKLCASRAFPLSGYLAQSHEMLFDAHTRAFTALGGVPRRGIYDNMKTAVDKVSKGHGRIINTHFFAMTHVGGSLDRHRRLHPVQCSDAALSALAGSDRFFVSHADRYLCRLHPRSAAGLAGRRETL